MAEKIMYVYQWASVLNLSTDELIDRLRSVGQEVNSVDRIGEDIIENVRKIIKTEKVGFDVLSAVRAIGVKNTNVSNVEGKRVYELASELNLSAFDLEKVLQAHGINKNAVSSLTEQEVLNVRHWYGTALAAQETAEVASIYAKLSNGLSELNTMRGGVKGFKGFVAEELQAAESSASGKLTYVINDNGAADLVYVGKNGHKYFQQMKVGYKPSMIDYEKYRGQTLVIDKGNPYFSRFKQEGAKYGVKVVEGNITSEEAQTLAKWMQTETSLTGSKTAVITPKVFSAHKAGLTSAKTGALYGGGFSLGSNFVDVMCGDKTVSDAACDVAKDTAIGFGAGYAVGAAGSAVASTGVGAAAISAVSGAVSTAAGVVGSTAVGGAVLGAGATAVGAVASGAAAVGAAGAAATGAVVGAVGAVGSAVGAGAVAATTAVAGTAAGAAVAGGVAAAGAAAAAVGAAAVAAAPAVAVGAVIGGAYKLFKKLF